MSFAAKERVQRRNKKDKNADLRFIGLRADGWYLASLNLADFKVPAKLERVSVSKFVQNSFSSKIPILAIPIKAGRKMPL